MKNLKTGKIAEENESVIYFSKSQEKNTFSLNNIE